MDKIFIYHNPRWGKSRESVKILENSNQEYEPPSLEGFWDLFDYRNLMILHAFICFWKFFELITLSIALKWNLTTELLP